MGLTKLPIDSATDEQIREFCVMQDLDPGQTTDRFALMALLAQAWPNDYVFVAEDSPNGEQSARPRIQPQIRLEGGIGAGDPRVILEIGNGTFPGGQEPVPVSVNGRTLVIQRNKTVELPYRFYLALQNAKRAEVIQEVNRDGTMGEIRETTVTNYPMSVHELPPRDEVQAWVERTEKELMPA